MVATATRSYPTASFRDVMYLDALMLDWDKNHSSVKVTVTVGHQCVETVSLVCCEQEKCAHP